MQIQAVIMVHVQLFSDQSAFYFCTTCLICDTILKLQTTLFHAGSDFYVCRLFVLKHNSMKESIYRNARWTREKSGVIKILSKKLINNL